MKFDLWDVQTNQYLGSYEDEAEALVLVRTLVSNFGAAYADDLELGGTMDDGDAFASRSGAALISRADEVLSGRQTDPGVIGSKVRRRGIRGEKSMVAAAASNGRRLDEARNRERQKP